MNSDDYVSHLQVSIQRPHVTRFRGFTPSKNTAFCLGSVGINVVRFNTSQHPCCFLLYLYDFAALCCFDICSTATSMGFSPVKSTLSAQSASTFKDVKFTALQVLCRFLLNLHGVGFMMDSDYPDIHATIEGPRICLPKSRQPAPEPPPLLNILISQLKRKPHPSSHTHSKQPYPRPLPKSNGKGGLLNYSYIYPPTKASLISPICVSPLT